MEQLWNDFSPSLFFMQAFIFTVLVFVLRAFAWKPIMKSILEREDSISEAINNAEEAKKASANMKAENEKLMNEVRAERDAMMKSAKEHEAKVIAEAKDIAKVEADKMLAAARESIEREKVVAFTEIKSQVAHMSLEIAEKILKSELSTDKKQAELANKLVEDINLN